MFANAHSHGRGLVAAPVEGHHSVHLHLPGEASSLCGLSVRRAEPAESSFRTRGCLACLEVALTVGHSIALDGDRAWINLARMQPSA